MDKKRVLAILSSSRKNSNSGMLAESILKGAAAAGAEVAAIHLADLHIKPCLGCYVCASKGKACVQKDDMVALYPQIAAADALVLASPIYFFNMSGQLKVFLDRCLPVEHSASGLRGKKVALAMSYGGIDPFDSGCINAIRCFQDMCNYCKMSLVGQVYGSATEAGALASNPELLEQAEQLGMNLV